MFLIKPVGKGGWDWNLVVVYINKLRIYHGYQKDITIGWEFYFTSIIDITVRVKDSYPCIRLRFPFTLL